MNRKKSLLNASSLFRKVNKKMRVNSKSSPNKIFKILPKFTYLNVFLGKFVYVHDNSLEILTVP